MEANELMYGNYVEHEGKVWQVNDIFGASGLITVLPNVNNETMGRMSLIYFQPIPLTEKWLQDFGFEFSHKSIGFEGEEIYYNIKGLEHLQDYGGQAQIVINKHGCYIEVGYYSNQMDCDHVHQLQNLYFALTGTHLTLNPPTDESKI